MNVPDDRRYTEDHEWAKREDDGKIRIGITDYAQDALGDIVYVELPEVGATVGKGDPIAEVESTKSVSDVYAPVSGTILEANEALADSPELVNSDPYGTGWFALIEPSGDEYDALLDPAAYRALTEEAS